MIEKLGDEVVFGSLGDVLRVEITRFLAGAALADHDDQGAGGGKQHRPGQHQPVVGSDALASITDDESTRNSASARPPRS